MSETLIKFAPELVGVIQRGEKTQTRRPIKPQPPLYITQGREPWNVAANIWGFASPGKVRVCRSENTLPCPYGQPGARLHVEGIPLVLEVTRIRVERLQDISDDDAIAEGVQGDEGPCDQQLPPDCFATLWDRFYAETFPWDSNPWVWVVEFKMLPPDLTELRDDATACVPG